MTPRSLWRGDAPAKVNLRLRVFARRGDGYHPVETVLQTLELCDHLELSPRLDDGVALELSGVSPGALGPDEDNLAVRAAYAFGRALARRGLPWRGVTIRLQKSIPHGAGLGGGSSDAAAVLRGMNELFGGALSLSRLLSIGAELGSDVPFFVRGRPRALAWARGEKTLALPPLPAMDVLVAVPVEPVATAWAYRQLDTHRASHPGAELDPALAEAGVERGWEAAASRATNDFEAALFPLRPDLHLIKGVLQDAGARPALLAGSGSALFGVFEDEGAVARAESALLAAAGAEPDSGASRVGALEGLRIFTTRTRA